MLNPAWKRRLSQGIRTRRSRCLTPRPRAQSTPIGNSADRKAVRTSVVLPSRRLCRRGLARGFLHAAADPAEPLALVAPVEVLQALPVAPDVRRLQGRGAPPALPVVAAASVRHAPPVVRVAPRLAAV